MEPPYRLNYYNIDRAGWRKGGRGTNTGLLKYTCRGHGQEPKAGRFYGFVKNHIDRDFWPEVSRIPPLRPVVSESGSKTENISHFVDKFAKVEVPKLDSFVEDTRHPTPHYETVKHNQLTH